MGKDRESTVGADTPKGKLVHAFKLGVIMSEKYLSEKEKLMVACDLYDKRKKEFPLTRGTELTDEEFIREWICHTNVPHDVAFEAGLAIGQMLAQGKESE